MPPKRNAARTARNEGSDSDADYTDTEANRTVVSSPNVTMSEEMLQNLVSSITRSQAESSRTLLESILTGYRGQHSQTSSPQPDSQRPGNFAKCTARFDGRSKNADELEAFIDAIEVYRECTNVSDEHALRGLPMLLVGEAAVWWQGVKSSVTSWTEALQRLRGMFGVPRPAYKIFRDIFSAEQSDERADVFVNKVRALLSKLPYVVPEAMKLDIVYGLLDRRIRKRVPRDAVDGLEQLICKVRLVEESLAEVSSHVDNNNSASPVNPPTARCRSTAGPSVNPFPSHAVNDPPSSFTSKHRDEVYFDSCSESVSNNPRVSNANNSNSEGKRRVRPRCSYCKLFGHTKDNCRNKEIKSDVTTFESNDSNVLRCYGCGQLGVVRSKCDNCKGAPGPSSTSKSDFSTAYVIDSDDDPRPLIEIQVVNRTGVAIIDTGATHSIASPVLFNMLREAGVTFRESKRIVGLANGSQHLQTTLEGEVKVTLKGRIIPTAFLVLPHARTRTLLGRDFITRAGILLDLPQSSWRFNDGPRCWHPFITSFELSTTGKAELMKVEAADRVLQGKVRPKGISRPTMQLSTCIVHGARGTQRVNGRSDRKPPTISPPDGYCPGAGSMQGEAPGNPLHPCCADVDLASLSKNQIEYPESRDMLPSDVPSRGRRGPYKGFRNRNDVINPADEARHIHSARYYSAGDLDRRNRFRHARDAAITAYRSEELAEGYRVPQLTPSVGDGPPKRLSHRHRRGRPKVSFADLDARALCLGQRGRL